MSHGAAGFAYALASLAAATGREEFARAAPECLAFENSSYDAARHNWPDRRASRAGLAVANGVTARPASGLRAPPCCKRGATRMPRSLQPISATRSPAWSEGWPGTIDTLCCGTLGSIEFFCEAAEALGRPDLRELASRAADAVLETARAGDYRWNSGKRQFNLGLFRGLAGVGYTLLAAGR